MKYFLGADVGGTKTHVLIADEAGHVVGFGKAGPGNHEVVGYEGLASALATAMEQALAQAGVPRTSIAGAGFGVAGFDWPAEEAPTLAAIRTLQLSAPLVAVNDTLLGLLAGSETGWGVAVVSGTGCNCWGWDETRRHIGHVTGGGWLFGEAAGAAELVMKTVQALAYEWTRRGPATSLTPLFIRAWGATDLPDLLEGVMNGRYAIDASAAPLVFQAAAQGDAVALDLIRWAGYELGQLALAVIRQLHFEGLSFEVILTGSMFDGSPLLTQTMRQTVQAVAPGARLVRLTVPPVIGAVLLGMEQAGVTPTPTLRQTLAATLRPWTSPASRPFEPSPPPL